MGYHVSTFAPKLNIVLFLLQGGFYSLGEHQFDIRPNIHRPEQAHVTRKPVVDKSKHFTRDRGIVTLRVGFWLWCSHVFLSYTEIYKKIKQYILIIHNMAWFLELNMNGTWNKTFKLWMLITLTSVSNSWSCVTA